LQKGTGKHKAVIGMANPSDALATNRDILLCIHFMHKYLAGSQAT